MLAKMMSFLQLATEKRISFWRQTFSPSYFVTALVDVKRAGNLHFLVTYKFYCPFLSQSKLLPNRKISKIQNWLLASDKRDA